MAATISEKLLGMSAFPMIIVGLWVLTLALYLHDYMRGKKEECVDSRFRIGWSIVLIGAFLIFVYVLYDVNVAGNAERYGSL